MGGPVSRVSRSHDPGTLSGLGVESRKSRGTFEERYLSDIRRTGFKTECCRLKNGRRY